MLLKKKKIKFELCFPKLQTNVIYRQLLQNVCIIVLRNTIYSQIMNLFSKLKKLFAFLTLILINSCSTIESTVDSTLDTISEAGDFLYDSVNFWEEEEPEQSEAIVIEEAVEVPEYAIRDSDYFESESQQTFRQPQPNIQPYYNPIYRSQRQYYFVGPNGTPMLAPPPPPFPQYSIDQVAPIVPYSYSNNLGSTGGYPQNYPNPRFNNNYEAKPSNKNLTPVITLKEEMELFGIQNDCIRVVEDYINGGFMCDDYD